ncbi:MAG: class I SAM-dependent methyltransferase [Candidatus Omnitrophota bacterium]|nr:MAG: class I SAM-dependent methyltransferase [Candidatus Omnitrophota bacterium]
MKQLLLENIEVKKIKQANRIIFDRNSQTYSKKRRIRFDKKTALRLMQRYEDAMGRRFQAADTFLDIGCGSGLILLNLAKAGFISKAYGIDLSFGMLKECKNNATNLATKVFLAQSDVEHLPFKSNSFSLIMGHAILHHLPDIKMAFRQVHRLLKPKGVCIFTEPTRTGSKIIATLLWFVWFFPMIIRQVTKSGDEKLVEVSTFAGKELEVEAKEVGFSHIYTKPFAGFISRIFYWIMDPISQRISSKYYHSAIDRIVDILSILDRCFFRLFIPKGWFDEVFIFMQK